VRALDIAPLRSESPPQKRSLDMSVSRISQSCRPSLTTFSVGHVTGRRRRRLWCRSRPRCWYRNFYHREI